MILSKMEERGSFLPSFLCARTVADISSHEPPIFSLFGHSQELGLALCSFVDPGVKTLQIRQSLAAMVSFSFDSSSKNCSLSKSAFLYTCPRKDNRLFLMVWTSFFVMSAHRRTSLFMTFQSSKYAKSFAGTTSWQLQFFF